MKSFTGLLFCLVLSSACANATCVVNNITTHALRELINSKGGWPITSSACKELDSTKMDVNVTVDHYVDHGVSVGWAAISLEDHKTDVISSYTSWATTMKPGASDPSALDAEYDSIRSALNNFHYLKASVQITQQEVHNDARALANKYIACKTSN